MKALLPTFLLLFSCTDYSHVSKDAMGLRIEAVKMEISHLKEIEWTVGKRQEATVSQSVVFIVDLPRLKDEDLEFITSKTGANAWILRLIAHRGSEKQDLGSLYAPFKPAKVVRGQSGGAPSSVSMKIYYAAAYASMRFRSFKCPALGHDKRVKDLKVAGENSSFELIAGVTTAYNEKSQLVELHPSAFNGGNKLAGEYYIEIAPYNFEQKTIHASFKRIPSHIEIVSEESVSIKSCAGVHEEIQ